MFHATTQKVSRLTETCLMALVVPYFSGNKSFTGFMLIELGKPFRFHQLYWLSSSPTIVNIRNTKIFIKIIDMLYSFFKKINHAASVQS